MCGLGVWIASPARVQRNSGASSIAKPLRQSSIIPPIPSILFIQMSQDRTALEERCNELRNELKDWEKRFAHDNDGKKATRDDIKADLETGM